MVSESYLYLRRNKTRESSDTCSVSPATIAVETTRLVRTGDCVLEGVAPSNFAEGTSFLVMGYVAFWSSAVVPSNCLRGIYTCIW